jgi:hypothetical protein
MLEIPIVDDVVTAVSKVLGTDDSGRVAIQVVKLVRLHCFTTEDWSGADEAELTIYAADALGGIDAIKTGLLGSIAEGLGLAGALLNPAAFGKGGQTFKQSLNDGQDMTLGIPLPLLPGHSFGVRLVDEDSPDADDHLASVTVKLHAAKGLLSQSPNPLGADVPVKNISLQGDGAHYELVCDVVDVTLVSQRSAIDGIDIGGLGDVIRDTTNVPGGVIKGLNLGGLVGGGVVGGLLGGKSDK